MTPGRDDATANRLETGAGRGEANTSRLRVMHTIARAIKISEPGFEPGASSAGRRRANLGVERSRREFPLGPSRARPRLVPRVAVAFDRLSHHQKMHPKMIVVRLVFRSARTTYRLSANGLSSTFAP